MIRLAALLALAALARGRAESLHRHLSARSALELAVAASEAGRAEGVNPALLMALVDVESQYDARALSPAGCVGWVQLAPRTARAVARQRGLPRPSRADLRRPGPALRVGAAYFADLLRAYGSAARAASAWNRGPALFEQQGRPVGSFARAVVERASWYRANLTTVEKL